MPTSSVACWSSHRTGASPGRTCRPTPATTPRPRRSWRRFGPRSRSVRAVSEVTVVAPFAGTVVAVWHDRHDSVVAGEPIVVLEAMKMEHEVVAELDGELRSVEVAVGDMVEPGQRLAVLAPAAVQTGPPSPAQTDPPATASNAARRALATTS